LGNLEDVVIPAEAPSGRHVYHLYPIRVRNRGGIMEQLGRRGVQTGIHYPIPVHLQPAYQFLGHEKGSFPVAEKCADEFLSLPMFPELRADQVARVAQELKCCLEESEAVLHGGVGKSF
jgi:dTDP-4-amino-4,6-dideoxygalactose transaminase